MEKMNRKAVLVKCIQDRLFPELLKHGFIGPDPEKVAIDDRGVEPPPEMLLYHFRQSLPSIGRVVATVSIKSFSRPTFQIKAGHVPEAGVKRWRPEEIIQPEKVTASNLQERAFLQSSPKKSYAPFRQPLWAYLFGLNYGIYESVDHAIALLPALVNWLKRGEASENVWLVKSPRPMEKQV